MRRRAKAAAALGFTRLLGPPESAGEGGSAKVRGAAPRETAGWVQASDIQSALKALFGK